jgi:predicted nucleic acid-binding protein
VPVYFFDSSAMVKRYINEVGTGWVTSLTDPTAGNRIQVARITGVEVVSAITRRARDGSISTNDAAAAIALFRHHLTNRYFVSEVTRRLITDAMRLAENYALRGYDAVQLAAALALNDYWLSLRMPGLTLVSADGALNTAAVAEGLAIDDPNTHP